MIYTFLRTVLIGKFLNCEIGFRMAGSWEVTKGCAGYNEQIQQWGPWEVEF